MERLIFADKEKKLFTELGLENFKDFFGYSDGRRLTGNKGRDVIIMDFHIKGRERRFFMKRFFHIQFKDMLFTLRNFGHLCSQAACEWKNANLLLKNSIGTYRPLCFGERMFLNFESRSFLITEELPGKPLTDFVAENWSGFSQSQKERIIVSLAEEIAKIHDVEVSMPDLYLWHVFITEPDCSGSEYGDRKSVV